ncbi:MAG TPA: 5-oxoprolinase subunit PxpA [Acidimicrobiales bacterium]|nr:5-oxoprolinase subunit PxpA [Acidimicrobiales bacterium]
MAPTPTLPRPTASVDLNADVGEGVAGDEALLDLVTSASVACGGHAGDLVSMRDIVAAASARGVVIGAHPSYDDRAGFGRRPMAVEASELTASVRRQLAALEEVARAQGTRVRYVKAHGALYHRASLDAAVAGAVLDAFDVFGDAHDVVLLVPPGSAALAAAEGRAVRVATEAFADRAYEADGSLRERGRPGALCTDPDEAARRARSLALAGTVHAVDGTVLSLSPSSICVHGDTPGALDIARRIRGALDTAGVAIASFAP